MLNLMYVNGRTIRICVLFYKLDTILVFKHILKIKKCQHKNAIFYNLIGTWLKGPDMKK